MANAAGIAAKEKNGRRAPLKIAILAAALAFLIPSPSLAASSSSDTALPALPEILAGVWGMPGCGDRLKIAMIYTRHFSLTGYGDRFIIRGTPPIQTHDGIIHLGYEQRPYDLKPNGADELLYLDEVLAMLGGPSKPDPFTDKKHRYMLMHYARCAALPVFNPDGMDMFKRMDGVAEACAGKTAIQDNPACQAAAFSALDVNNSGALDEDELAAAYRKIRFIVAGTSCSVRFPGDSEAAAPAFAAAALEIADRDGSGTLDMHEIAASWIALETARTTKKFTHLAHMMSALIPAIPVPEEPEPACTCGAPSADPDTPPPSSHPPQNTPAPDSTANRPLMSLPPTR